MSVRQHGLAGHTFAGAVMLILLFPCPLQYVDAKMSKKILKVAQDQQAEEMEEKMPMNRCVLGVTLEPWG